MAYQLPDSEIADWLDRYLTDPVHVLHVRGGRVWLFTRRRTYIGKTMRNVVAWAILDGEPDTYEKIRNNRDVTGILTLVFDTSFTEFHKHMDRMHELWIMEMRAVNGD